jgi:hypothetical protein
MTDGYARWFDDWCGTCVTVMVTVSTSDVLLMVTTAERVVVSGLDWAKGEGGVAAAGEQGG